MFRPVLLSLALFAGLLVAFALLMGVSKMDVSVKHAMQRHVVAEPFEAGDVVEISPDGQRVVSLLCKVDLPDDRQQTTVLKAKYYNVVDRSQARFMDFVDDAKSTFGLPLPEERDSRTSAVELPFEGEVQRVVGSLGTALPPNCVCDIAAAVLESRSAACMVEKSLVETQLGADGHVRRTVGVTFRERPIVFRDPSALSEICPSLNVNAIPPAEQSCAGESGYSIDVMARGKIGLIREARLE